MSSRRAILFAAVAVFAGAAAVLLYGGGRLNNDSMWTLAWGRQIAAGVLPDFDAGPTPHPLPNAIGVLLAPLGSAGEPVLLVAGWLSGGVLVALVGLIALRLFGLPAAVAAAVLFVTLIPTMLSVAPALVDVPYAALVLTAVAMELDRPRRGAATLAVLAVAGLLRPEAWLLSGAYWLWLTPTFRGSRQWLGHSLLVAVGPVLWAGADLITTGDPMYSFTHTTDATPLTGRDSGVSAILHLPRFTADNAGALVCLVALVGFAAAVADRRVRLAFASLVLATASAAAPVLAGTPLNERYLLASFALLCVFAAGGALGWVTRGLAWQRYAGIGLVALLAVQAAINLREIGDQRTIVMEVNANRDAARKLITAGPMPCSPLVVPAGRVRQLASVWTETPLEDVLDGHDHRGRGTYLTGSATAMDGVVTLHRRAGTAAPVPEPTELVRRHRGWELRDRCPGSGADFSSSAGGR